MRDLGTRRSTRKKRAKGARITRGILSLVSLCLTGSLLAQPVATSTPEPPSRIFRIAYAGPISTLDPIQGETNSELSVIGNLVEPLLVLDPQTGLPRQGAAERVDISQQGKRLTFTLRSGLKWSNGEPVTATDFVYSLRRLLERDQDSWAADLLFPIQGAYEFHEGAMMDPNQLGIRAEGERRVILDLTQPNSEMPFVLALPATAPVHRETIERFKGSWWRPEHWVGNGMFVPTGKGESLYLLRKNPHHRFANAVAIDEAQVFLVADAQEGTNFYLEGKIDQFGQRDFSPSTTQVEKLVGRKDLLFQDDLRSFFLRLNPSKLPLSQLALRQVLAMSVDRPLLLDGIVRQGENPAFSLLPMGLRSYAPPVGYLLNVPGARKLLRQFEYCGSEPTTPNCKSLPVLSLIHRPGDRNRKIALALKAQWKEKLFLKEMEIVEVPADQFDKKIEQLDYAIALDDLAVEAERPFGLLDLFRRKKGTAGGFSHQSFDDLLDAARSESNWDHAKNFYRRAEALLLREGGIVPLFYGTTPILISPRVQGYVPNLWGPASIF